MTEKIKHSRLFLWFIQVLRVCGRELLLVFRDEGVVIFFLLLNAVHPVLYALIYNPEVVRNEAVVVVDDSRTAMSRDLVRRMDATQEVAIVGYAANNLIMATFLNFLLYAAVTIGALFMLYYLVRFIIPGLDDGWLYFTRHLISRMVLTWICTIPFYFLNKLIQKRLNPEG